MKLSEYKKLNNFRFKETTISFLVKNNQVLLAMKKRGFGVGKWNGVGGKKMPNESILQTATREAKEEIMVEPITIRHCATIYFYLPHDPEHNQKTSIFIVNKWKGKPTETEEMSPRWFNKFQIPYESMWSDDSIWLPKLLNNENFTAEFLFDKDNKVADYLITDNVK